MHISTFANAEADGPSLECFAGNLNENDGSPTIVDESGLGNGGSETGSFGQQPDLNGLIDRDSAVCIINFIDDRERARLRVHHAAKRDQAVKTSGLRDPWNFQFGSAQVAHQRNLRFRYDRRDVDPIHVDNFEKRVPGLHIGSRCGVGALDDARDRSAQGE